MRNRFAVATAALAVIVAACGSSATTAPATPAPATPAPATAAPATPAPATPAPATPVVSTPAAATPAPATPAAQDFSGKTINVAGAFVGSEADAFQAAVKPFEDATGAKVTYTGSKTFEQDIQVQVQAGNTPDVGLIPQPGAVKKFAQDGKLIALPADVVANIDANYGPGWKDLGTVDGKVYGVFHRVNVKAQVFYPLKAFTAKGYAVPTTWTELQTLMDKMVADGTPPWCVGLESGTATGWPATDWMEQIILRQAGPDAYDKWVNHQIPFNDPIVKKAAETMGAIMKSDTYVYGGPQAVVTTNFGDFPKLAFDNPPKCWFTNQGNFITSFFPDAIKANLDAEVGVFALPAIDPAIGTPAEVGGDQLVAFANKPEVMAFLKYMATPAAAVAWQKIGGALFPYKNQDLSAYASALDKGLAQSIVNASSVRFDGSDAMPPAVGSGTFWKGMVDYVSGSKDIDTVLAEIEASWPK